MKRKNTIMNTILRLILILVLASAGAGNAWSRLRSDYGHISYTGTAANDGGTLAFHGKWSLYWADYQLPVTNGHTDELSKDDLTPIYEVPGDKTSNIIGYRFYILAAPEIGHKLAKPDANGNVSFIRAEVVASGKGAQQVRRRTSATFKVGQFLDVKYYYLEWGSLNNYCGVYYVDMPADPNLSVSITAEFPLQATTTADVSYIDADGSTKTKAKGEAYVLDGTEPVLGYGNRNDQTHESWYVVPANTNINYTQMLMGFGKIHLILSDGATLTYVGADGLIKVLGSFDIYGQSQGSGKLDITSTGYPGGDWSITVFGDFTINGVVVKVEGKAPDRGIGICVGDGDFTLNGGEVTTYAYDCGLWVENGNTFINGGKVTATCGDVQQSYCGFLCEGNITLDWKKTDDFFYTNSYDANGSMIFADGKIFKYTDGGNTVKLLGTLTSNQISTLDGKTLTPYGYGGYCGKGNNVKDVTWEIPFGTDGKLSTEMTVDGMGDMADYDSDGAPWKRHSFTVANIEYPVTSIGKNAFKGCQDLKVILAADESAYYTLIQNWTDDEKKFLAPRETLLFKNESGWGTYCHNFPVSYSLNEGKAYDVTGLSADGKSVVITEVADNYVTPLTPLLLSYTPPTHTRQVYDNYIVLTAMPATAATLATTPDIVDNGGTDIVFYGNPKDEDLSASKVSDYIYIFCNTAGKQSYVLRDGNFLKVDENQGIGAHRCWLNVTGTNNARVLSIIGEDEETSLSEEIRVKSEELDDAWYDLNGRKVNAQCSMLNTQLPKGIYINNGKKVVVK